MGWSCTAAAGLTLDAIKEHFTREGIETGNGIKGKGWTGFWETGPEHEDGAITGSIFKDTGAGYCRRVGSFRIEPDGRISRFPGLGAAARKACEETGAVKYRQRYGPEGRCLL